MIKKICFLFFLFQFPLFLLAQEKQVETDYYLVTFDDTVARYGNRFEVVYFKNSRSLKHIVIDSIIYQPEDISYFNSQFGFYRNLKKNGRSVFYPLASSGKLFLYGAPGRAFMLSTRKVLPYYSKPFKELQPTSFKALLEYTKDDPLCTDMLKKAQKMEKIHKTIYYTTFVGIAAFVGGMLIQDLDESPNALVITGLSLGVGCTVGYLIFPSGPKHTCQAITFYNR
jgi:hypothetical protein